MQTMTTTPGVTQMAPATYDDAVLGSALELLAAAGEITHFNRDIVDALISGARSICAAALGRTMGGTQRSLLLACEARLGEMPGDLDEAIAVLSELAEDARRGLSIRAEDTLAQAA